MDHVGYKMLSDPWWFTKYTQVLHKSGRMKKQVASVVNNLTATRSLLWRGMDHVGYKMLSDSDPHDEPGGENSFADAARTVVITVHGMTCGSCVRKIMESVETKPG